jgi:amino acid permease
MKTKNLAFCGMVIGVIFLVTLIIYAINPTGAPYEDFYEFLASFWLIPAVLAIMFGYLFWETRDIQDEPNEAASPTSSQQLAPG